MKNSFICFLTKTFWIFFLFSIEAFAHSSSATQLPLPRFASLKSDEVNLRTGPGSQYPVVWTLVRAALPIKIVAEFGNWREIRDWEDSAGWVHQSLLTGKRTVIVVQSGFVLKESPSEKAPGLAYLEKGLVGTLLQTQGAWCQIKIEGAPKGWFKSTALWGV